MEKLGACLAIAKIPLCLLVAFSALFGFQYGSIGFTWQSIFVFIAVFLLACGAATLNSYQECDSDGLMQRTKNRPLVIGKITNTFAFVQASILISAGLALLLFTSNVYAFSAGILGVALYNLVYTRLKPISFYAIVPGAICGAIPPYIGWLAADGGAFTYRAILLVMLLVFWQIPHFFLVLLNHKADYLSSLSPNLLKMLSEHSLRRIFLPWITALAVTMLIFTVLPSSMSDFGRIAAVINALTLFGVFCLQLLREGGPNYRYLFRHLNISIFLIMLTVCFDSLMVYS